jgi:hypothetical protein
MFIPQVIYAYGQPWWNNMYRGKAKNSEKTCPRATLSATNSTWADPGTNLGLSLEKGKLLSLFGKKY